jgi:hypothetical protein
MAWNDKQQLALSPHPLLRAQSELISTIFIRQAEKVVQFKQQHIKLEEISPKRLNTYLSRMCELKSEYPECAPCYFDVLAYETKLRPDQVVQYL